MLAFPVAAAPTVDLDAATLDAIQAQVDAGATTVLAEAHARGLSRKALSKRLSRRRAALAMDPNATGAPDVPAAAGPREELTIERTDADMVLRIAGTARLRSVDELLAACDVDPLAWRVVASKVKQYDGFMKNAAKEPVVVPLRYIEARLEPTPGPSYAAKAIEVLTARMADHAPTFAPPPPLPYATDDDLMLEVNLSDAHLGMLAWGAETGEDYDTSIAVAAWRYAVDQIVGLASHYRVARILLPTGNDLLHADVTIAGKGGATTAGTPQDMDTRWPRMLVAGTDMLTDTIEQLQAVAPVDVEMVPGNHDQRSVFSLGLTLRGHFRNCDRVTVGLSPAPRKYREWGRVLIGLTHGHGAKPERLPLLMATEAPEAWARTTWREWRIGHYHAAKAMDYAEFNGVRVVVVPGMTASDSWHVEQGLHHQRCAEARLWSASRGPVGTFNVWLQGGEALAA